MSKEGLVDFAIPQDVLQVLFIAAAHTCVLLFSGLNAENYTVLPIKDNLCFTDTK
jgi:hypothetical protein